MAGHIFFCGVYVRWCVVLYCFVTVVVCIVVWLVFMSCSVIMSCFVLMFVVYLVFLNDWGLFLESGSVFL